MLRLFFLCAAFVLSCKTPHSGGDGPSHVASASSPKVSITPRSNSALVQVTTPPSDPSDANQIQVCAASMATCTQLTTVRSNEVVPLSQPDTYTVSVASCFQGQCTNTVSQQVITNRI